MRTIIKSSTVIAAALIAFATPLTAGEAWDDVRAALYGDRAIAETTAIDLKAPYRTMNDPRTRLGASVTAPPGERIAKVTLIIDENPAPVSAEFAFDEPQASFTFSADMRVDRPSSVRVVVETADGDLMMAEKYVKTSGVGACAAPPGSDPVLALANMGKMALSFGADSILTRLNGAAAEQSSATPRHATLSLSHPSHSGMQMDQISLLYIPARFVEQVTVAADQQPLFTMTGSISLSEDPKVSFDLPGYAAAVDVEMTDSDGAVFRESFSMVGG